MLVFAQTVTTNKVISVVLNIYQLVLCILYSFLQLATNGLKCWDCDMAHNNGNQIASN